MALIFACAVLEMPPSDAVIVVGPTATLVARPPLSIVAFVLSDESHTTDAVMSFVLLSEYLPVALNCRDAPRAMLGLVGVTVIEVRVAPSPPPPPPPQDANSAASERIAAAEINVFVLITTSLFLISNCPSPRPSHQLTYNLLCPFFS